MSKSRCEWQMPPTRLGLSQLRCRGARRDGGPSPIREERRSQISGNWRCDVDVRLPAADSGSSLITASALWGKGHATQERFPVNHLLP